MTLKRTATAYNRVFSENKATERCVCSGRQQKSLAQRVCLNGYTATRRPSTQPQTNELRKLNTMITADIENSIAARKREEDEKNTSAAMLLAEDGAVDATIRQRSIQNRDGNGRISLKATGGRILGALKFGYKDVGSANSQLAILQKAKEMKMLVVQRPTSPVDDSSTLDDGEVNERGGKPVNQGAADEAEVKYVSQLISAEHGDKEENLPLSPLDTGLSAARRL